MDRRVSEAGTNCMDYSDLSDIGQCHTHTVYSDRPDGLQETLFDATGWSTLQYKTFRDTKQENKYRKYGDLSNTETRNTSAIVVKTRECNLI